MIRRRVVRIFVIGWLFIVLTCQSYGKRSEYFWSEDEHLENLTIRFEHLGFKVLCEPELWKPEFDRIRANLAICLNLNHILVDEEESEEEQKQRNFGLIFGDYRSNFYCRLAKHWPDCRTLMQDQHCLEPDPERIIREKRTKLKMMILDEHKPNTKLKSYDWRRMHRPYRVMCELARVQFQTSPFGPYGKTCNLAQKLTKN